MFNAIEMHHVLILDMIRRGMYTVHFTYVDTVLFNKDNDFRDMLKHYYINQFNNLMDLLNPFQNARDTVNWFVDC
jgi:hypothetical protein